LAAAKRDAKRDAKYDNIENNNSRLPLATITHFKLIAAISFTLSLEYGQY